MGHHIDSFTKKTLKIIAIIAAVYFGGSALLGFPTPRGVKVDRQHYTYYRNIFGTYYISVQNLIGLITHGDWEYLHDVDNRTFTVLDDTWAKDANHVWYAGKIIEECDAESFTINKSGMPVDKNHVYVRDRDNWTYRPAKCDIDIPTAEYFIALNKEYPDENWMRDKDFVYLNETKLDVDRNSFTPVGSQWFTDKDNVYGSDFNKNLGKWILFRIDSLRHPVEPVDDYLRNGNNVIFCDSIIIRDLNIKRIKMVGILKYLINDMLYFGGRRILDSLDIANAKFYFHGHIVADGKYVFYGEDHLSDIDAATFRQIGEETFEDKNYVYTIKEKGFEHDYPFDRKEKQ